jgi:hypothetical protein
LVTFRMRFDAARSEARTADALRAPGAAAWRETRAEKPLRGAEVAPGTTRPIATTRMMPAARIVLFVGGANRR